MSDGEVTLPGGIGGVGRRKALEDSEGLFERRQSVVDAVLGSEDVADSGMSDGEFTLPGTVRGVERREALDDGEVLAERDKGVVEATLCLVHVANEAM